MGRINPRLTKFYSAVKPGVALPIIVTTAGPVTQATLDAAAKAGAGPIKFTSQLGNAYGTTATEQAAQRLGSLESTVEVFYDEPTVAF